MTLFLVRHAMPVATASTSSASWSLSEDGRRAARELGARLPSGAVLVASEETKAIDTVAVAAGVDATQVGRHPGFGEVNRPGESFDEHHRARRLAWVQGALDVRHVGWETRAEAAGRFQDALDQLVTDQHLVVGSHGMVMTAWLVETGRVAQIEAGEYWLGLGLPELVEIWL